MTPKTIKCVVFIICTASKCNLGLDFTFSFLVMWLKVV